MPLSLFAAPLSVQELEPFLVRSSPAADAFAEVDLLGADWRQRGATGLAEALESAEPGVSLVRKAGMSNDVVLRGLGGDDLSVALDGRKIFCACSNRMDPPLSHATAESAARVEISAGPFSLKRSGSLAGYINIVSAEIEPGLHGAFDAGLSSYQQQNHSGWTSYREGDHAMKLQGGYLIGDAYETGSGQKITELPTGLAAYLPDEADGIAYQAWHFGGEWEWSLAEDTRLRFNALRREDEGLLFPGLKMDADYTQTTQLGGRLTREAPSGIFDSWVLDAFFNDTDHLMSDSRRMSSLYGMGPGMVLVSRPNFVLDRGYFMETDAVARNWGSNFDGEIVTNDFGVWSVGAEWGQRQWLSDNVMLNIDNAMLPDVLSTTLGGYAQGQFTFESGWTLELGSRLDLFTSEARGDTTLLETRLGQADDYESVEASGFASFRYQWSESVAFFGGLGSVSRAPNPQELYIQVDKPVANPDWLGNPSLDAPRSTEVTAGIEWFKGDFDCRVRIFHSWLDDYIYPVAINGAQSYANVDARLYGMEWSARYKFNDEWSMSAGLAGQIGLKEKSAVAGNDRDLAEIPPLRLQAALQYEANPMLIKLEARASDDQGRIDSGLNEQNLGAWWTLSLYARRNLGKHWSVACAVENIFDQDYALHNAQVRNPFSDFTVVNEPGRLLKLNVSYIF